MGYVELVVSIVPSVVLYLYRHHDHTCFHGGGVVEKILLKKLVRSERLQIISERVRFL